MFLFLLSLVGATPWNASMAAGDCVAVTRTLSSPSSDLERLAIGRCEQELGQTGASLEVLGPLQTGVLAPYAALVRGKALLDRDRPKEAAEELAKAPASSETSLLRGRALVQDRRSSEAREMLRGLLETSFGPEARYWLAVGARDRGETAAAVGTFQAVWVRTPTSPWADKAAKELASMGVVVPDFSTEDGRSVALSRAKALLGMHLANLAIPLLDPIHTQDPFDTPAEQLFMAEALFDAHSYKRAVEWYERVGTLSTASDTFHYALATARAGNYDGAATIYGQLISRFPGTPQADEAAFKPGYMRYDAKDWPGAIAAFDRYLSSNPNGKFASDARWFRAWATYKSQGVAGLPAFDLVIRSGGDPERVLAARYWKARLTKDDTALRQLIQDAPESAYAWFAGVRLGIPSPTLKPLPAQPTFPAGFVASRPGLPTALTLLDGGMADWARPLLRSHVDAAKQAGKEASIAMSWVLLDAEDYQGAKALAGPYCSDPKARPACYPRPHDDLVQSIAAESGLDPLLPYAIMNAESGLDPSVTSPAGARGLMQLMPELAVKLADDLPGFSVDQLYRAGTNAQLGTRELSGLHLRFANLSIQPSLPLVIASYNGGADSVERWLGAYPTAPDVDEFAEDISYTETRRYVRRVLGYLMQYRRVYSAP